ncbi:MAG: hypothetical protein JO358_16665, partial [Alphaproteobacteria bacterium]|nr:hypothetical protein [Alphaproteobacteria bacterium]
MLREALSLFALEGVAIKQNAPTVNYHVSSTHSVPQGRILGRSKRVCMQPSFTASSCADNRYSGSKLLTTWLLPGSIKLTRKIGAPDRWPSVLFCSEEIAGPDEERMGGSPAMNQRHLVCRSVGRVSVAMSLLVITYATVNAQGTVGPAPVISPEVATLVGTVSVAQLSASQANRGAQQKKPPVEMPKHRLPDGSVTSAPSSETVKALPLTPEPNAGVENGVSRPFKRISGFTGIFEGDNFTINGFDLEPPDQGLAVHDNVVAEINNLLLQFFNSDGTLLTNPIPASAFFLADGAYLTDTQAFFDPRSKRWFFDIVVCQPAAQCPGSGAQTSFQGFGLAVSKTDDPLGEYFIYHIRAFSSDICGGVDCFPDFPKAGYDANAFFITADLPNVTAVIYVLPKRKLEAGADFTYIRFDRIGDFIVQPSVPATGEPFATASGGTEYLLVARNLIDSSNNIRVIAIYNTSQIVSSPGNLQQISVDVAAQPHGYVAVP